jgi:hypothetical protein
MTARELKQIHFRFFNSPFENSSQGLKNHLKVMVQLYIQDVHLLETLEEHLN